MGGITIIFFPRSKLLIFGSFFLCINFNLAYIFIDKKKTKYLQLLDKHVIFIDAL